MFNVLLKNVSWQKIINGITPEELGQKLDKVNIKPINALESNNAELMRVLLVCNNVNEVYDSAFRKTLLHRAVALKSEVILKILLEFGANVDALDYWEAIPLFYLYPAGEFFNRNTETIDLQVLKSLTSGKTSLTSSISTGPMQISRALQSGSQDVIEIILQSNVDLTTSDDLGNTALHYLVKNYKIVDFQKLTDGRKFNVKARNNDGYTPLMMAAQRKSNIAIKFLLENGAGTDLATESGITSLYLLYSSPGQVKSEIVENLLSYGADPQSYAIKNGQTVTIFDSIIKRARRLGILGPNGFEQLSFTANPLLARLAIIQACGTKITELTLSKINKQPSWIQYFETCQQQVKKMKETTIYGNITLLQFLVESEIKIMGYVRNKELVLALEKVINELDVDFMYTEQIQNRLTKVMELTELKEKAISAVFQLFEMKNIVPYCIAEYIIKYLSIKDMRNLEDVTS